jgi:hypothetical protein
MLEKLFGRKKVKPQKGYETECWSSEAERRGRQLRDIVNPKNLDLLVYYPASGGETIISRFIGAGTQVQVTQRYEHGSPFLKDRDPNSEFSRLTPDGKECADGERREYKVQWLKVVDYWGDAFKIRPPEVQEGIDVYIDKCGISFKDNPEFKTFVYNLIREGGYVIDDGKQSFFVEFDPELFGFNMILDREDRPCCKGQPFHLRVFKKNNGLYLPEELFEADLAIADVKQDRRIAEFYASKGWDYKPKTNPREVEEKIKIALDKIEDTKLASRLSKLSQAFF